MKEYVVSVAISDTFLNGDFRFDYAEVKEAIVNELNKFKHRRICKNLFEVTSPIEDSSVLYKTLVDSTYSVKEDKNLFNEEIDVIYIMPLSGSRYINGEHLV